MAKYSKQTQEIMLKFLVDQKGLTTTKRILKDIQEKNKRGLNLTRVPLGSTVSGIIPDRDLKKLENALKRGKKTTGAIRKDLVDAANEVQRAFAGSDAAYQKIRRQRLAETAQNIADEYRVPLQRAVEEINKRHGFGIEEYQGADDLKQAIIEGHEIGGKKSAETFGQHFQKLARVGMTGFTLVMAGMRLKAAGQAMLTQPAQAAAGYYGNTTQTTAEWNMAVESISRDMIRFGKTIADTLTPYMKKLSDVVKELVDYLDEHPLLSKVYSGTGLALLGGGVASMLIGQIMSGIAAFASFGTLMKAENVGGKFFAALKGFGASAAAGAGKIVPQGLKAGATKAVMSPYTLGIGLGVTIWDQVIARIAKVDKSGTILGKSITSLAYAIGSIRDTETAERFFWKTGQFLGVISKTSEEAKDLGPGAESVEAFIDFLRDEAEALKSYNDAVAEAVKDYNRSISDLENDYQKDRQALIDDFNKSNLDNDKKTKDDRTKEAMDLAKTLARMEEDYYRKRRKAAEQYSIEVQRAEEDHQIKMRQMYEDNQIKIRDLADARDAFGIVRQLEAYEIDRRREEEEYQLKAARRSEDFARELAEMEEEYRIQRARRIEDFNEQLRDNLQQKAIEREQEKKLLAEKLKELDKQHEEDLKRLDEEQKEKLADLKKNYDEERKKRRIAFNDQLRDLAAYLLNEAELRNSYYIGMSKNLEAWLESMNGQFESALPGYPTKHAGGYTSDGLYMMKANEFVLTPSTTRLLEKSVGGNLSQKKIVDALSSNLANSNNTVSVKADITVSSMDPIASYKNAMTKIAEQVFISAVGG